MSALWWLLPLALAACLAVLAIAACLSPKPYVGRHLAVVPDTVVTAHPGWVGSMILDEEREWQKLCAVHGDICDVCPAGRCVADEPLPDWREQTAADLAPEALGSDVQPDPYLDAIAAGHGSEYDPGALENDRQSREERWDAGQQLAQSTDSGPGGLSSLTPGPAPNALGGERSEAGGIHLLHPAASTMGPRAAMPDELPAPTEGPDWLDAQLAVLYEWVRAQYAEAAA